MWTQSLHKIFKRAHLKFTVYAPKQANIHTQRVQCSSGSVRLAQAHPNYVTVWWCNSSSIFCMHIGHHSQGFKSDFKKVKCVQMQKMLQTIIIVPGAEIKVWFRFMLALHESREKTQSKNPFGGKKAHGKNLNGNWHISTIVKKVCSVLQHRSRSSKCLSVLW